MLVEVFREVYRVLRRDGVLWLVLGDARWHASGHDHERHPVLKRKDLIGLPWRVALALQADGWYLRHDIIWAKPDPMPEPVRDRPTRAHEYVFLLSKSPRYFYDPAAIAEPAVSDHPSGNRFRRSHSLIHGNRGVSTRWNQVGGRRNRRDVWRLNCGRTREAHSATFPPALVRLCLLAGSRPGDLIFDPFAGVGTVGQVCARTGRRWLGLELSPEYLVLARRRAVQIGLPFRTSIPTC